MNIKTIILPALALVVMGCNSSNDGSKFKSGNAADSNLACGATTASTAPLLKPAAVPPGGADIGIQRVFPAVDFDSPVALTLAPDADGCWFVVEQAGRVIAFANRSDVSEQNVFVDITDIVDDDPIEAGLLGIAFHPNYAENGQVFLSYTGNNGGLVSYVSRFFSTDGGATLDPATEQRLIRLPQPFLNHNGGNILFGPDGYLYIGFGDGGSANDPGERSQNTLNLFGSILRIDVDDAEPYAIPNDNPFAGNALCDGGSGAADCPEIFAYGLRNPWRWSFDRETGDLWAGDVGQNQIEEIDIIDLGGNYGWPFFEGTRCNTEAPMVNCSFVSIPPITEYGRSEGRSVTGGYVYRGNAIPDLVGVYVYADISSRNLFQFFDAGSSTVEALLPIDIAISSFAEDVLGELYVLDYVGGGVYQIAAD